MKKHDETEEIGNKKRVFKNCCIKKFSTKTVKLTNLSSKFNYCVSKNNSKIRNCQVLC